MNTIELGCACGNIRGEITRPDAVPGNHLVCYCKDCQAFPTHLGKQQETLDEAGGTRIYQIPPAILRISQGEHHLACLRLTPNGLYRWYAKCCNTPIGNTVGASLPFVGVIHTFISGKVPSPVMGCVHQQSATATIPAKNSPDTSELAIIVTVMRRLLWWKLSGKGKPNPLFNASKEPVSQPEILSD